MKCHAWSCRAGMQTFIKVCDLTLQLILRGMRLPTFLWIFHMHAIYTSTHDHGTLKRCNLIRACETEASHTDPLGIIPGPIHMYIHVLLGIYNH